MNRHIEISDDSNRVRINVRLRINESEMVQSEMMNDSRAMNGSVCHDWNDGELFIDG